MLNSGAVISYDVVYDENGNYYSVQTVRESNNVIMEVSVKSFFYTVAYHKLYDAEDMLEMYKGKSVGDFLIDALKHRKEMTESKRGKIYSLKELDDLGVVIRIENAENYKSISI